MLRAIAIIVGAVIATGLAYTAFILVALKLKKPSLVSVVRRVNKNVFNRMQSSAGQKGRYSLVHHVGRSSGKEYTTPVEIEQTPDGYAISLPYSTQADWAKNVLKAGNARFTHEGETFEVGNAELRQITGTEPFFSDKEKATHARFNVTEYIHFS